MKVVGRLVLKSYGAMTVLLSFFDTLAQLKMQIISKWMYRIGVSRV